MGILVKTEVHGTNLLRFINSPPTLNFQVTENGIPPTWRARAQGWSERSCRMRTRGGQVQVA